MFNQYRVKQMIMKMMTDTRKLLKKRYRTEKCIEFLSECNRANVFPSFCRITKKSIENAKLSPNQVTFQIENFQNAGLSYPEVLHKTRSRKEQKISHRIPQLTS